ncbi:hypothetical protein AAFF_G00399480 [Aldrovandia affinis]|uniref:Uncharacterized protein n=1 Tax=Aldrovandia affinis TaxID=143900 RepID=A0AAD7SCW7_9TELE|nr:hypothetical protein AAFF_G00399480 [Aldrovandia affinis]
MERSQARGARGLADRLRRGEGHFPALREVSPLCASAYCYVMNCGMAGDSKRCHAAFWDCEREGELRMVSHSETRRGDYPNGPSRDTATGWARNAMEPGHLQL